MCSKSDFTEPPKFQSSSLTLIFGQSGSGKSTWLTDCLIEHNIHFERKVKQLIYVSKHTDKNVKKLKSKFKAGMFINEIPTNLEQILEPSKTVIVFDDCQQELLQSKEKIRMLKRLATISIHHDDLMVFITFQDYEIFYKRNELNFLLFQTSCIILFRSLNNFCSLKRFLNSYEVKLKGGETLYNLFKKFVQGQPFSHIIINLSTKLKCPQVYSQILFCDDRPLLIFHEEE